MIKNSEVVFIYKVNGDDLVAMTELFGFSEEQLVYVRNSKIGSGLAKLGDTIIPFEDDFPRSSKLYRLITTKPGEFLDTE